MPKTRHSVGMQVVNRLASQLGVQWRKDMKKCGGFVAFQVMYDILTIKVKVKND
jgi:peptidyl-tRNA hydrolase